MSNVFTLKQRFLLFFAGLFGPVLINLLGLTWRVRLAGNTDMNPRREKTSKRIYCFWHKRLLGLCYTQRGKNVGILISSHFDGEIIARIVARLDYHPIRGSSTKGGSAGLLSMLKNPDVWYLGITVDGPRGPKGVVKPGVIYLAAKSGLPIVPISCISSSKWVLSSWDSFEIPKPFARVVIGLGEPIYIKNISDNNHIDEYKDILANKINELEECL